MDAHTVEFTTRIEVAFDVGELVYPVHTFLDAASMIYRLGKT
jgi:hypothetical protein